MRVFLDTNVLFSSAYTSSGPPARLLDMAAEGVFQAVVSRAVLRELARNLINKAPNALGRAEAMFENVDFEVAPEAPLALARLQDATLGTDAPIIAAAIAANVDYFCTGDRRLLERGRSGALAGLRVVGPSELVRVLDQANETPPSGQA